MKIKRIIRHLFSTQRQLKQAFPQKTLNAIEHEIKESENAHSGEIRFAVECALSGLSLYQEQSTRERAIDVFSQWRMWDTEQRNGVLIYLLLADHSVDIVADRGVNARAGEDKWQKICHHMEAAFRKGDFEPGTISGIREITHILTQHFPAKGESKNELPDKVIVL